jgi:hypothetical protein
MKKQSLQAGTWDSYRQHRLTLRGGHAVQRALLFGEHAEPRD